MSWKEEVDEDGKWLVRGNVKLLVEPSKSYLDRVLPDELNINADKTKIVADGVDTATITITYNKLFKITDFMVDVEIFDGAGNQIAADSFTLEDVGNYVGKAEYEFASEVPDIYTLEFTLRELGLKVSVEVTALA